MSNLPIFPPMLDQENRQFWEATAKGVLLIKRCDDCGEPFWYPRFICPFCHSTNTSWMESNGTGTIYTYTVSHRGNGPWRQAVPYVIAYVELAEGPRMLTNIIDCDPAAVSIGKPVVVSFEDTGNGNALPRFRLAE